MKAWAKCWDRGWPRPPPFPFTMDNTTRHDLSFVPTPEGIGEVELHQVRLLWPGQARPTHSARTEGIAILSIRTNVIPAPRRADKTAPPDDDDRYGEPPSKYGLTGRAYNPPTTGCGSWLWSWLPRLAKPTKAMTPELGIVVISFTTNKATNDHVAQDSWWTTNVPTLPPQPAL
jgi:hypothetical protein